MPNIKSAIKRVRSNERKANVNLNAKSGLKTALKKFNQVATADNKNINEDYKNISRTLDMAASKGTIHKNTAARKKSRLAKKVNALAK